MPAYNGHKSWNAWNVARWIRNDEALSRAARRAKHRSRHHKEYPDRFYAETGLTAADKTPDGGVCNRTAVQRALQGLG